MCFFEQESLSKRVITKVSFLYAHLLAQSLYKWDQTQYVVWPSIVAVMKIDDTGLWSGVDIKIYVESKNFLTVVVGKCGLEIILDIT